MRFNTAIFSRTSKCFRSSWNNDHYLTYDGENFIEHVGAQSHIWYWQSAKDFENAVEDLNALDWSYTCEN